MKNDLLDRLKDAHDILSEIERLSELGITLDCLSGQVSKVRQLATDLENLAGSEQEPEAPPRFVAAPRTVRLTASLSNGCPVMQGNECVGVMRSHTFAKRTAKALNEHKVNREGV